MTTFHCFLFLFTLLLATTTGSPQMVGYWGQDSSSYNGGPDELSLGSFCQDGTYDIIVIGFLCGFGNSGTSLNLANHCDTPNQNNGCPDVATDIQTCQSAGKKILLSLGGASSCGSGYYGFTSNSQAQSYATTVWNMFLGGSGSNRPFGSSVILDGIDLDPEEGGLYANQYGAFVVALRNLFPSTGKQYYISGAPQCPYPDANLGPAINSQGAQFDFIWVQFYNNGYDMMISDGCDITGDNYDNRLSEWASLASSKGFLLFIGTPSATPLSFQNDGYVGANAVNQAALSAYQTYPSVFGGVMVWDVSGDQVNSGFIESVSSYVHGLSGGSPPAASSSSSASPPPSSASPPPGSCTDGYMRCVDSSTYQECEFGSWAAPQSCQAGLTCTPSGNYIYCE